MSVEIPAEVQADGASLRVRRAWPLDAHGLSLELVDEAGIIRGARIDRGRVRLFPPGTDPRLPGLARAVDEGAVVLSHRPGRRAVLRRADGTFVKVVRRGRGSDVVAAARRGERFAATFQVPRILAADDDAVTLSVVPGHDLHMPAAFSPDSWQEAWHAALQAWLVVTVEPAAATTAQPHDHDAERAVLEQWAQRADETVPDPRRRQACAAAARMLAELVDADRYAVIHRDLHDKQLFWHPESGPGVIDLDTVCEGDPGVDLGNLRAHARWRAMQGLWSPQEADAVRREVDDAAQQAGIDHDRVRAYECATAARLACVYAFRPRWRDAARHLI
ncbi:MAG: phosphotransferase [Tessaracoccus sp.]|uniref:phosphotransferase n=1 Tax=Tessaracoccus sp. TaxID=1971211 RepID=UPI001EC8E0A6|nr:phosphotransferase [Tessaracoccus sp.]MBK7821895.1 phosphotransferase [Tessaracoccus sp.]